MLNCVIIGAGIAGCVAARKLAEEGNRNVLVIERLNHFGGNCFDETDDYGILVQKHGPHIFHTENERVREYLSRFTDWYDFKHEVVADISGLFLPVPFNLNTLRMVFEEGKAERLERKLIRGYGYSNRVSVLELRKDKDSEIREVAEYAYNNIYLKYTIKQWGHSPEKARPEVLSRVPIVISKDNCYFKDRYQGVPLDGFTSMFRRMLNHRNIEIRLETDCADVLRFVDGKIFLLGKEFKGEVIYTGAIDELFRYRFGRLPYRTLNFKFEHYDSDSFLGHSVVNYTMSEDFTRITEFKYLTGQKDVDGTTIAKEYPRDYSGMEGEIPYYAVINDESRALYEKYRALAMLYDNFYLLGRLAEFKYYNMDEVALKAMDLAESIMYQ